MKLTEKIAALVDEGLAYSEEEALSQLRDMGEDYDEDDTATEQYYAGDGVFAGND